MIYIMTRVLFQRRSVEDSKASRHHLHRFVFDQIVVKVKAKATLEPNWHTLSELIPVPFRVFYFQEVEHKHINLL